MLENKFVSMALSAYSNPGVYALLLGSGVSKSAGIPTGWDIVIDLCRKIAQHSNEDAGDDPVNWFVEKYQRKTGYDILLKELTQTAAERQSLLEQYFVPNEIELEEGLKQPTKAHRAIAKMAKAGFIRIILTTNFDSLMEDALREYGVRYTVISHESSIPGARPYVHAECTIIKLHGDYRDTRFLNITSELSKYPEAMNNLLSRILDEFGLIVTGWSGIWDEALRLSMLKSKPKYGWYWLSRGEVDPKAQEIIDSLGVVTVLPITDADTIFEELQINVEAAKEIEARNPITPKLAQAITKKFIPRGDGVLRITDLIISESRTLHEYIHSVRTDFYGQNDIIKTFGEQLDSYILQSKTLASILSALTFYGNGEYDGLIKRSLEHISHINELDISIFRNLKWLPTLILVYSSGIAAILNKNYQMLDSILIEPSFYRSEKKIEHPFITNMQASEVLGTSSPHTSLPGISNTSQTKESQFLKSIVKEIVLDFFITHDEYSHAFNKLEFLIGTLFFKEYGSLPLFNYLFEEQAVQTIKDFIIEDSQYISLFKADFDTKELFKKMEEHINQCFDEEFKPVEWYSRRKLTNYQTLPNNRGPFPIL